MKKKKNLLFCLIFAVVLLFGSLNVLAAGNTAASSKASAKSGWFNKGNKRYYRKADGKLYKNTVVKIGKYTYCFDKKGCLVKGAVKTKTKDMKRTDYYNKKNGRYEYSVLRLRIIQKTNTEIIARYGISQYQIESGVKCYTKKGKELAFSNLKKNQRIDVYYNGSILEVYPAIIEGIQKIRLV